MKKLCLALIIMLQACGTFEKNSLNEKTTQKPLDALSLQGEHVVSGKVTGLPDHGFMILNIDGRVSLRENGTFEAPVRNKNSYNADIAYVSIKQDPKKPNIHCYMRGAQSDIDVEVNCIYGSQEGLGVLTEKANFERLKTVVFGDYEIDVPAHYKTPRPEYVKYDGALEAPPLPLVQLVASTRSFETSFFEEQAEFGQCQCIQELKTISGGFARSEKYMVATYGNTVNVSDPTQRLGLYALNQAGDTYEEIINATFDHEQILHVWDIFNTVRPGK